MSLLEVKGQGRQQPDRNSHFKHRKDAWFAWLEAEREAEANGYELGEEQFKNFLQDGAASWIDNRAWQEPEARISSTCVSTSDGEARQQRHSTEKPAGEVASRSWADLSCDYDGDPSLDFAADSSHQAQEAQEALEEMICNGDPSVTGPCTRTRSKRGGAATHQEPSVRRCKRSAQTAEALRVVWCDETCHKSQNDDQRKGLWRFCRDRKASLLCLKKATKFATWLESVLHPNYILFTDWREAKPCMDAVVASKAMFRQMVVFCETDQMFKRASDWAGKLPLEAGLVHISKSAADRDGLMKNLISQLASTSTISSATSDCKQAGDCKEAGTEVLDSMLTGKSFTSSSAFQHASSLETMTGFEEYTVEPSAVVRVQVEHAHTTALACSSSSSVLQVLGPVLSAHTAVQLKEALEQALPDCYAD